MGWDPEEAVRSREGFVLFSMEKKKTMKEKDLEKRRKWMMQEKGKLLGGYVFGQDTGLALTGSTDSPFIGGKADGQLGVRRG